MKEKNNIFTPFKIRNIEIRNRIVMPPMDQYLGVDGFVNDWHLRHYQERAVGGVGLIIVESAAVMSKVAMISDGDLGIWDDKHIDGLKNIVDSCHKYGAKIALQLNHAGRKCEVFSDKIYAPSPIAIKEDAKVPIEMTKDDIKEVRHAFVEGAKRAVKAGFDAIELHGAHGYLISEFLSPLSNKRTDEYGKNRGLFLEEILKEIRKALPSDYPIGVRVSARDWKRGGNEVQDMVALLKPIESLFDYLNVSSGAVDVDSKIIPYPGYQIFMASWIKEYLSIPCIGGGLITDAKMANSIVRNGAADAVYIGRELLRNPYWPLQASRELGIKIDYFPIAYKDAAR